MQRPRRTGDCLRYRQERDVEQPEPVEWAQHLGAGHQHPAGQRQGEHQQIEGEMDRVGGRPLPAGHGYGMRRWAMPEPPGDPGQRQHQNREAERLVQGNDPLDPVEQRFMEQAKRQIDDQQDRDDPVQRDRAPAVTVGPGKGATHSSFRPPAEEPASCRAVPGAQRYRASARARRGAHKAAAACRSSGSCAADRRASR